MIPLLPRQHPPPWQAHVHVRIQTSQRRGRHRPRSQRHLCRRAAQAHVIVEGEELDAVGDGGEGAGASAAARGAVEGAAGDAEARRRLVGVTLRRMIVLFMYIFRNYY